MKPSELKEKDLSYWTFRIILWSFYIGIPPSLVILHSYNLVGDIPPILPITIGSLVGIIYILLWLSGFWRRVWDKEEIYRRSTFFKVFLLVGFCLAYITIFTSFCIFLNCQFDNSEPTVVEVKVIKVEKYKFYDAKLERDLNLEVDSITIKRSTYKKLKNRGGILRISIQKGLFGIKWISKEEIIELFDTK